MARSVWSEVQTCKTNQSIEAEKALSVFSVIASIWREEVDDGRNPEIVAEIPALHLPVYHWLSIQLEATFFGDG
jgi:hypothetical protein